MRYKIILFCPFFLFALAGCTDTSGLSSESSRTPHPKSTLNAVVTVVEFADLQCPACRTVQSRIVEPMLEQYGSDIRYEFKHFPLQSIHQYALIAAQASECAADQDKFWEYIDLAYEDQANLNKKSLEKWAELLRLDMDLFNRCLKSQIKRDVVLSDYKQGKQMSVSGTPAFFVNGKKVSDMNALGAVIRETQSGMLMRL